MLYLPKGLRAQSTEWQWTSGHLDTLQTLMRQNLLPSTGLDFMESKCHQVPGKASQGNLLFTLAVAYKGFYWQTIHLIHLGKCHLFHRRGKSLVLSESLSDDWCRWFCQWHITNLSDGKCGTINTLLADSQSPVEFLLALFSNLSIFFCEASCCYKHWTLLQVKAT